MSGTTVRVAGTVIENRLINGCVTIEAANVIIRNSKIVCGGFFAVRMPWQTNSPWRNLVMENVEIDCGYSEGTGVGGANFTARRMNVHGCTNGFAADSNVVIENSYIHDFRVVSGGHTDGVQMSAASNVTIQNNTILAEGNTSAIISDVGQSNVFIGGNLLGGGAYTLYCPRDNAPNFRVVNNRFVYGFYNYGPLNSCDGSHVSQFTGNVWDDTGRSVTSPR